MSQLRVDSDPPRYASVVVVGGGLSGLETAKELDRLGLTGVVVLEAGPTGPTEHINALDDPEDADRRWLVPGADRHLWRPWRSASDPHYAADSGLRRRLGGRSLYWQGVCLPLEPWALADPAWPREVVGDLAIGWRGGPSLYERALADLSRWCGRPVSATRDARLRIGNRTMRPVPQATRAVPGGNGRRWAAYSPLDYWAAGYASPANHLVTGTEVLCVEMEGGRTRTVVVRAAGGERQIRCEAVVLAAGTIQNSRLAIQARYAARVPGQPVLTGLVDHITQGFTCLLRAADVPPELLAAAAEDSLFCVPCAEPVRSNLFLRLYINPAGAVVVEAWAMGEQLPGPTGTVRCLPGTGAAWDVLVSTELTAPDMDVIAGQRNELQDLYDRIGGACRATASGLKFPEYGDPEHTLHTTVAKTAESCADQPPMAWCGLLGAEDHESSTLPLGTVLTDRHEVVPVPGLYAAGPCAFPRPGAANPSLTTIALAKRLAATLLD